MKILQIKVIVIVFGILAGSCKKFLDIDLPRDKISQEQAFENDDVATSAVTGIYSKMITSSFASGGINSLTVVNGFSSDELINHFAATSDDQFYTGQLTPTNSGVALIWSSTYNLIYSANSILEGLGKPNGVSVAVNKQLSGEAKFIRAFCYFYLVNEFGDVPLHLSTDYRINENSYKTPKSQIYLQIVNDLKDSENLLSDSYVSSERVRPNKWVAKTLLARVYLYLEKWKDAENKATEIIDHKLLYNLVLDLDKVFLKNSMECIWQLMPTTISGKNTNEGSIFIINSNSISNSLSDELYKDFAPSDKRKVSWIKTYSNSNGTYYYAHKYKIKNVSSSITEYSMVMRLAELFLIRSEALTHQGNIIGALEDLNKIRSRAGLTIPLSGLDQSRCLQEVEYQRRLELFTEWGHRWLDLKRSGRATQILGPLKGETWTADDLLYPIPQTEIDRNINIKQNSGY